MRRAAPALLVAAAIAGGAAHAKPPAKPDYDDQNRDEDGFWSRVAHPNRGRYKELVAHARILVANHAADPRAELDLLEAVKLEPDQPFAHYLLAEIYRAQHRFAECADRFLEVDRIDPEYVAPTQPKGSTLISYRAAFCLALAGRLEESIEAYRRVIAGNYVGVEQESYVVHYNIGDSYHALGRLEEAIDSYQRALDRVNPSDLRRSAPIWFALGVAYDRDEQIANSREAILKGLGPLVGGQRQGYGALGAKKGEVLEIFYLPPEDEDYYIGLAHLVDHEEHAQVGRRAHAIARLRRYVADAADQPWVHRARQHLVALGSAALSERELIVFPGDAEGRAAITKAILAAGPELQKCLEGTRYGAVELSIQLVAPPAKGDKKAPVPTRVAATPHGPETPRSDQLACVIERARAIKLNPPAKGAVTVITHLIALE